MTTRRQDQLYTTIGIMFAFLFFLWLAPSAVTRFFPAWLWYDIRDVRVDSETTAVTLDRTIRALPGDPIREVDGEMVREWDGHMQVTIRQVGYNPATGEMLDDGHSRSSCPGVDRAVPFTAGQPYPKVAKDTGAPRDLAWFLAAPPNAGCTLVPGAYVADFTWSRTFLGFTLRVSRSSNIFTMTRRLDMSALGDARAER